jgi:hypothetical protein
MVSTVLATADLVLDLSASAASLRHAADQPGAGTSDTHGVQKPDTHGVQKPDTYGVQKTEYTDYLVKACPAPGATEPHAASAH